MNEASTDTITVLGATGTVGEAFVRHLTEIGKPVIAVGRNKAKLAGLGCGVETRLANLTDNATLGRALADAQVVVSCAHARFARAVLSALPPGLERLVLMGSTRRFTSFRDQAAEEIIDAERAFEEASVPGVIIHPTMIYGASRGGGIERIACYIEKTGMVPLPGGGRSLIQPIHMTDVVRALVAAADRVEAVGSPIVIAGRKPVSYAELVDAIARAIGRKVRILPVPLAPLTLMSYATGLIPGLPEIKADEVRRLAEDKDFDTAAMRERLCIQPMSVKQGLRLTFAGYGKRSFPGSHDGA